ncbi:MAG: hypothetical protein WCS65_02165 [Verrucomicrobiae bacterium]
MLILCLGGCAQALAKERVPIPTPPPFAKSGTVSVYLTEPAEIPLSIGGRIVEPLSFLIRKPPRRGVLSGLSRTGRTEAVVTYTPNAGAVPGEDSLTFAAQSPDSPVSAPATVRIRLLEKPPVLLHPLALDFGTVYLGDESGQELVLKNGGGGRAGGQIQTSPPWFLSGNSTFHVPSGSEARILLVFRPTEERAFSDRVQLGSDPMACVELRGIGAAPLTWPKAGLIFSPDQRAKGFSEVAFGNQSPHERTLTFEWPEFLHAPRAITLAPGESASVKAEVSGPIKNLFEGSVRFQSGNFSGEFPLKVYPRPAKLTVTPEEVLDLGETQKGKEISGRFTVRNTGESDAPISISAPEGMRVIPDPQNLILGAGEQRVFEIQFASFKPGSHRGILAVRTPSGEQVQLAVSASVRETSAQPVGKFLNMPEPVRPPELATGKVPPVREASAVRSGPHEIEISWKAASPDTSGYRIQRRKISASKEARVVVEWLDWPAAKIATSDGAIHARLENLPENSRWAIRIISLDPQGLPGPPSPAFQIFTQPGNHRSVPLWAWIFVLSAAIAFAIRLAIQRRRALLAHEDERLARIEGK